MRVGAWVSSRAGYVSNNRGTRLTASAATTIATIQSKDPEHFPVWPFEASSCFPGSLRLRQKPFAKCAFRRYPRRPGTFCCFASTTSRWHPRRSLPRLYPFGHLGQRFLSSRAAAQHFPISITARPYLDIAPRIKIVLSTQSNIQLDLGCPAYLTLVTYLRSFPWLPEASRFGPQRRHPPPSAHSQSRQTNPANNYAP